MARMGEPIVDDGTNLAALDWRLAFPFMTGDEQDDPVAAIYRQVEAAVQRLPRPVERMAVKIEDAVDG